jgi:ATP adenylyltransferase/5',5'''-P-1,P-4-tetraphosphate phosphorylase II
MLRKKPDVKSKDAFSGDKKAVFNPFVPPFEANSFINDVAPNHRLIFNKF